MTFKTNHALKSLLALWVLSGTSTAFAVDYVWKIDTAQEWTNNAATVKNINIEDGVAAPTADKALFSSTVKMFNSKKKPISLTLKQTALWRNWKKIPSVKPRSNNAPVFLPVADGEYYFFACRGHGGYRAWQSSDMKIWTPLGTVTKSHWVTTVEYKDGDFYIYYDQPNDEDPHLVVDSDIHDGKPGKDYGMVFNDPSHGSDCGVLRDEDGTFHMIYEDWTPVNARTHSWDSPLAGHTASPDGIHGFVPHKYPPAVDQRTKPTGEKGTYLHNHTQMCEYDIHEPDQNAYGDWSMIKVGRRYYLFGDYDSADDNKTIRVGCFTTTNINSSFSWCGEIGENIHPDPSIGFAEGQFYLIVQNQNKKDKYDFVSPGPWVGGVEARAGVDEDGDGKIDQWSTWQEVSEKYHQKPGFARVVEVTPASLDLSDLPPGKGFKFELRISKMPGTSVLPVIDGVQFELE